MSELLLLLFCVSEREPGGGEEDVPGSGALLSAEGNQRLERGRQVPAEPRLRPGAAQLRLRLLLLRATLHRGTRTAELTR